MVRRLRTILTLITLISVTAIANPPQKAAAADFFVYSIYRALDLGNPGEKQPQKDYYVNMGSSNGVREGALLDVIRRVPTYDLTSQKLYKDMSFPIAKLKIIHTEQDASIARLETFGSEESTPSITPRSVMIGDLVRPSR